MFSSNPIPTFALCLAVHELATNASKYGSLSQRAGRRRNHLARRSHRARPHARARLAGARRTRRPSARRRPGFGSTLINMVITRQLNGEVTQTSTPPGWTTTLVVPLTHERWPGARPATEAEAILS